MGPKWFKVPSKCLLISRICWFYQVRKIWGFLSTSHAPITDNENVENKPYFCSNLLSNLADLVKLIDARPIILGIFDPFYLSRYGIPLDDLDYCWAKRTFYKFDVFQTPSEAGCSITSETGAPLLSWLSCMGGTYCDNMSILLLFSWDILG